MSTDASPQSDEFSFVNCRRGLTFRAELRPFERAIALWCGIEASNPAGESGITHLARRIQFDECDPCAYIPEPTVKLTLDQAQHLMDELWRCGLRPTEGTGSAGALAAVNAHLQDMRRLVFREGA